MVDKNLNLKKPNWERISDYLQIQSMSSRQLAWEFLRRSEKYRQSYFGAEEGTIRQRNAQRALVCESFKIARLANPDRPVTIKQSKKLFVIEHPRVCHPIKRGRSLVVKVNAVEETSIALVFDLAVPIKRQLAVAQRRLEKALKKKVAEGVLIRPVKNRRSAEYYVRYLRVLDALSAGANDDHMVSVFAVDYKKKTQYSKDNLRKDKVEAMRLTNAYRSIASLRTKK